MFGPASPGHLRDLFTSIAFSPEPSSYHDEEVNRYQHRLHPGEARPDLTEQEVEEKWAGVGENFARTHTYLQDKYDDYSFDHVK
jgi:hypothetical protein